MLGHAATKAAINNFAVDLAGEFVSRLAAGYWFGMHKSRIGGIFIDHPARSFEASRVFWAAAMGREGERDSGPYFSLGTFKGETVVELQRLDDDTEPRVHLDIDTDDVDAEADRLEALGARRLRSGDGGRYWQMVDPGGLVFCVIPPHTSDFGQQATRWN